MDHSNNASSNPREQNSEEAQPTLASTHLEQHDSATTTVEEEQEHSRTNPHLDSESYLLIDHTTSQQSPCSTTQFSWDQAETSSRYYINNKTTTTTDSIQPHRENNPEGPEERQQQQQQPEKLQQSIASMLFAIMKCFLFLAAIAVVLASLESNWSPFSKPSGKIGFVTAMSNEERLQIRDEIKAMFYHGYDNYKRYAFPKDELQPITCKGFDTWGGYSLTLIDSLDTLTIVGNYTEFRDAVNWVIQNINFDRNVSVSVFETNIRVLGGLISAHLLASDPTLDSYIPEYKGELLGLAQDLANRLLPAFDTPTGIPYGTVNLRYGVPPGEVKITCTAGGGTFILEFGVLSILTGDARYEQAARKAARGLHQRRSPHTGLVGNHINIYSGHWTHKDAGVGSGIDSFYEYMFKAYLLFGDEEFLSMYKESYEAIMKHVFRRPWYVEVHMDNGQVVWPLLNSLQAFWPGIQALAGEVKDAKETLTAFHSVWRKYGALPEGFNILSASVQPGQKGYPLRPELTESIYTLYRITRDPTYLKMGRDIVKSLNLITRTRCGYASVKDVETRELVDRMESFFLAETVKYLYLLFDEDNFVNNHRHHLNNLRNNNAANMLWTFNTEGHLIPLRREFLWYNTQLQQALREQQRQQFNITMESAQCKRDKNHLSYFQSIGVCELEYETTNYNMYSGFEGGHSNNNNYNK